MLEHHVEDRDAEEADAHHCHTHHGAGGEGDAQCRVQALASLGGGADVRANRDEHTDVAGRRRRNRTEKVRDRGSRHVRELTALLAVAVEHVEVDEYCEDHGHHGHEDREERVLTPQERGGTLLDEDGNVLHHLGALILLEDPLGRDDRKEERDDRGS